MQHRHSVKPCNAAQRQDAGLSQGWVTEIHRDLDPVFDMVVRGAAAPISVCPGVAIPHHGAAFGRHLGKAIGQGHADQTHMGGKGSIDGLP